MIEQFPNREQYSTNVPYTKHLTKHNLSKCSGKAEDIMVLTNGEKINPIRMNNLHAAHPHVRSVIAVGHARFQSSLLME